jgi:hypothetical protein
VAKKKPKSNLPKLKLPSGWKMEEVNARMRTPCSHCGNACDGVRFKHTTDGYPFPETKVFCSADALTAMRAVIQVDLDKIKAVEFFLENHQS